MQYTYKIHLIHYVRKVVIKHFGQELRFKTLPFCGDVSENELKRYLAESKKLGFVSSDKLLSNLAACCYAKQLTKLFWHTFYFYVCFSSNKSEAVQNFLNFYDITEEELSWDTAYKRWQRFEWECEDHTPFHLLVEIKQHDKAVKEKVKVQEQKSIL